MRATDGGLEVERVRSGSPAARIGVEKGDRLLGLGGVALNSISEFHHKMVELRAARDVLVTIGRGPFETSRLTGLLCVTVVSAGGSCATTVCFGRSE